MAMDLIAGRAGGPPPPPGAGGPGGGPPPDLAALLGAGGGAPPGPAPDQAPPDQGAGGPADPVDTINSMIDLGKTYLDNEQDQEDLLAMQKILTELQQLLAKDQQDTDNAMSGNLSPRTIRKSLG